MIKKWFVQPAEKPEEVEIVRGPNIKTFPDFEELSDDLINFGVVPLEFENEEDYDGLSRGE
jgi:aconitase A